MKRLFVIFAVILLMAGSAWGAAPRAVDDAPIATNLVGFGTGTLGAYGATNSPVIFVVTDLTNGNDAPGDSTRNGVAVKTGSFREFVNYTPAANTGKVCIFEVGGTIDMGQAYVIIDDPYVSILGATAPSPGITIKEAIFEIRDHDVFVSHVKFRPGAESGWANCDNVDGLSLNSSTSEVYNVVIDHCSVSWAIDENIQVYAETNDLHDITISNTLSSEALYNVACHSDSPRGMGLLIDTGVTDITLYRNLLANNSDRNPHMKNVDDYQIINNVIYNSSTRGIKLISSNSTTQEGTIRGNVAKKGPNSGSSADFGVWESTTSPTLDSGDSIYVNDLLCYEDSNDYSAAASPVTDCIDDVTDTSWVEESEPANVTVTSNPFTITVSASTSMLDSAHADYLLDTVGARPNNRDAIDTHVINDVINGTGSYINSQTGAFTSWPTGTGSNDFDTGALALPASPHTDSGNGYTNLEVWAQGFADDLQNDPPFEPPGDNIDWSTDVNVVAVWDFDNAATDEIGSQDLTAVNTPTYGSTTPPEGTYYAILDDTSKQIFTIPDASLDAGYPFKNGDATKDATIAVWFYIESLLGGGEEYTLYSKHDDTGKASVRLYIDEDENLEAEIGYNSGDSAAVIVHASTLSVQTWYLGALTIDSSETAICLYVYDTDGNEVGTSISDTATLSGETLNAEDAPVVIGAHSYAGGQTEELEPDGDTYANWTKSAGETSYTLVDDPSGSPTDAEYISTATDYLREMWTFDDTATSSGQLISALRLYGRYKVASGTQSVRGYIVDDTEGDAFSWAETSFTDSYIEFATDPQASAAWTSANIDSYGFGFRTADIDDTVTISNAWLIVYFSLGSDYGDLYIDEVVVAKDVMSEAEIAAIAGGTYSEPGSTITAATVTATTHSTAGETFDITLTFSENTYAVGCTPVLTGETAETDLTFTCQGGSASWVCTSDPLTAGMRTTTLAFVGADLVCSGGTVEDSGSNAATLTLPAITNTAVVAVPGAWTIPSGYADYAALLTAHGYLIGNDTIEVFDNANITITDEDGTENNPIVIYLRAGYSGTLDLNSNDYITVYYHPSATISNSGGTAVTATPFNGAAGL